MEKQKEEDNVSKNNKISEWSTPKTQKQTLLKKKTKFSLNKLFAKDQASLLQKEEK